jgi:predicted TIM-barrel fold metal-dependent hydrolase
MRILDNHCLFGRWPKDSRDVSVERLLKALARMGVERGVAASLRGAFYHHDTGNAETLSVCRRHRALVPAATINPQQYHQRGSLPAQLARQGFRLLRLFPHIQGWTPHGVVLERILGECTRARLPVAFPIGKFPDLASLLCRMAPKGCRLILSDVYYSTLTECIEVLRRRPEFFMEVGHTCAPGSLETLGREVGARRLVLGTNQPLESGLGAIEAVRRSELTKKDQAAILGGTLAKLLGGI